MKSQPYAIVAAALILSTAPLAAADILTQPYLQNVKTNGITIMWESDALETASVEYGAGGAYDNAETASRGTSGGGTYVYKVVLTGLEADAEYTYRLRLDGAVALAGRVFRTAPNTERPFRFGVWSDSQGTNRGAYGADLFEPTKTMMAWLASEGVDLAVACGDMAENGNDYGDVRQYLLDRVMNNLGQSVPFFIAWGNHDSSTTAVMRNFADHPSKERPGFSAGGGSYSFNYAGCHFVCVDYATMDADMDWIAADLASSANLNAKFTFFFIHVPPFCELWIDGSASLRQNLVPLLEQYGVDAVFSGHTHEYERGYLNGVFYCVTGGGSWLDIGEPVVKDWDHMVVGGAHDLPGRTHGLVNQVMVVDVQEDSWRADMHGFEPDGAYIGVLDSFSPADQPSVEVVFTEDFEGLQDQLQPAADENISSDLLGWTQTPPADWNIDNSIPDQGTTEWQGWSFATPEFWVAADNQRRDEFTRASGVVAVADPDEWDDYREAETGVFDSSLTSPSIPIDGGRDVLIGFDSHYRPEDWQTATLYAAFDGGGFEPVFEYDPLQTSDDGSTLNLRIEVRVAAPEDASSLQARWRVHNATNDWFWAIDNVEVALTDPLDAVADADLDGITDQVEGSAQNRDTDGDGTPDYMDEDSDGDGIPDRAEGVRDPDGDGAPNYIDEDSDGDGYPDSADDSTPGLPASSMAILAALACGAAAAGARGVRRASMANN